MSRLEEIQQRFEKSTPGTWEKRPGDVQHVDKGLPRPLVRQSDGQPIHAVAIAGEDGCLWHWITTACETNVDFIAHAHQDIPYLLRLVVQLTEERDRWMNESREAFRRGVESAMEDIVAARAAHQGKESA